MDRHSPSKMEIQEEWNMELDPTQNIYDFSGFMEEMSARILFPVIY